MQVWSDNTWFRVGCEEARLADVNSRALSAGVWSASRHGRNVVFVGSQIVVRLSARRDGRALLPGNIIFLLLVLISVTG
jgi:hypothetical protein